MEKAKASELLKLLKKKSAGNIAILDFKYTTEL